MGPEPWLLVLWALVVELLGRRLFPNWDVSYALYGARFAMERGGPWMNVWPGMDLLLGQLGRLMGQPEAAITVVGVLLNGAATLVVWALFRRLGAGRLQGLLAALAIGLWFKPPLGGWIGDHLSFSVALAPALALALARGRWSVGLGVLTGCCLSTALTLKLNNSGPGLLLSGVWMAAVLVGRHPRPRLGVLLLPLLASAAAMALLLERLAAIPGGLHARLIDTYTAVLASQATSQAAAPRLLLLPLQINPLEAISQRQAGVLLLLPLVPAFWLALAWSLSRLRRRGHHRLRHATALLLLLASGLVGLSLGRGLTHRLFLLPAGLLLSAADLPLPPARRWWPGALLLAWLLAVWISFAWVQRQFERTALYDSRRLLADPTPTVLCLGATTPAPAGVRVVRAEALPGARPVDRRCFRGAELHASFAGLVDVQELANALATSYPNQTIAGGDFREKWDWRQATPQGRRAWVRAEAARINALQLPYLVERLPLNDVEVAIPGYGGWRAPRLEQRRRLAEATGSTAIGRLGELTLWRTRWAP